jgi:O-acetyl-ADP-ribose deacetylase (regulator of RNase III)
MNLEDTIEFLPTKQARNCQLRAGDFRTLAAFESEVREFMGLLECDETFTISLLAPFKGSFAGPDAFDVICEVAAENEGVRDIRVLVASEGVAEKLRGRMSQESRAPRQFELGTLSVSVIRGDITEVVADAIVNASNTRLKLGAGVSAAIRQAAGPTLQDAMFAEAKRLDIKPGDVVVTGSHGLPHARRILHAATASGKAKVVAAAVARCLELTEEKHIRSLAFPALGTGTGGMDVRECAEIMADELVRFTSEIPGHELERVILVLWTAKDFDVFVEVFDAVHH